MPDDTRCDEIADGIYRISTFLGCAAQPGGVTVNRFLVVADEPLLFHTGHAVLASATVREVARVIPMSSVRWISFGHVEADECGAVDQLLAHAPRASVTVGSVDADARFRRFARGPVSAWRGHERLDLGGRCIRFLATPHVPHNWESGLFYEETGGTLFCGDILTHTGDGPALVETDIVGPALAADAMFHAMSMAPNTKAVLERLAALKPRTLALMHGSSFRGDGAAALRALAAQL